MLQKSICFFFLALLFTVPLTGCGDGKLKTEPVTGKVTFNGEPIEGAKVVFSPVDTSQGKPAVGRTNEQGVYTLQTSEGNVGAGTTPGEYIVMISKVKMVGTGKFLTGEEGKQVEETKPVSELPDKYSDRRKTELKATVVSGANTFDFDLVK